MSVKADEGTLKAIANDSEWLSVDPVASINESHISIIAKNEKGESLSLVVKSTATGTYKTTANDEDGLPIFAAALSPKDVGMNNPTFTTQSQQGAMDGQITITEMDLEAGILTGTFEADLVRYLGQDGDSTVVFESGSFNKISLKEEEFQESGNNQFTAKVDGELFSGGATSGVVSFGRLTLSSLKTGGKNISLIVPSDIEPGTYELGSLWETYSASYIASTFSGTSFISNSGSLTISKHDKTNKRIEGTFSFVATPYLSGTGSVTVTEGEFAVSY